MFSGYLVGFYRSTRVYRARSHRRITSDLGNVPGGTRNKSGSDDHGVRPRSAAVPAGPPDGTVMPWFGDRPSRSAAAGKREHRSGHCSPAGGCDITLLN